MKPRRARENRSRSIARAFLRELGFKGPPIDILGLIITFGKVKWHEDAGDGFTIYDRKRKKYCIFIDPELVRGRMNWSLCHELGHIVLGHFLDYDINNLSYREEKILDREADIFVKEFLIPEPWLKKHCKEPLTVPAIGKLKNLFGVSWEAISYRFDELGIIRKVEINKLFINWRTGKSEGYTYNEETSIEVTSEVAATSDLNLCTSIKIERVVVMDKPIKIPELDDHMRFVECPICSNDDFSEHARYCKKCGQYLYNICLNSSFDPQNYSDWCGKNNVADALYCEYCGAKTVMGELLNPSPPTQIDNDTPY